MSTVLYARVSTSKQTVEHQEAQARAAGFVIDHVVADNGVSGVSTRLVERQGGRRLFDLLRAGIRWWCAGSIVSVATTPTSATSSWIS